MDCGFCDVYLEGSIYLYVCMQYREPSGYLQYCIYTQTSVYTLYTSKCIVWTYVALVYSIHILVCCMDLCGTGIQYTHPSVPYGLMWHWYTVYTSSCTVWTYVAVVYSIRILVYCVDLWFMFTVQVIGFCSIAVYNKCK